MIKLNGLIILALVLYTKASLADSQVIDVRRNITLSNEEIPYKDFYLSGGLEAGYKLNQVVKAVRSLTIRDASGTQSYGQINIPVGQIKIIAVYDRIAVGREFKLLSRDDLPMLEQIGIMTGDLIDFKDAYIDKSAPKRRTPQAASSASSPAYLNVGTVPPDGNLATASPPTTVPLAPTAPLVSPTQAAVEKLEIKAQSGN